MVPPGNETGRPTASLIRRPSPDPPRSALTSHGQNPWPADAPRKPNSPRPAYSIIKNRQAIPSGPGAAILRRNCGTTKRWCCSQLGAPPLALRPSVRLLEPTPWVLRPDLDRTPTTTVARGCDASLDPAQELAKARQDPQRFRAMPSETWRLNESAISAPQWPRLTKPQFRSGHQPPNQTQQKPKGSPMQMQQAHKQV
jgi:hypothetical protein